MKLKFLALTGALAMVLGLGSIAPSLAGTVSSSANIAGTISNTCSIGSVTSPSNIPLVAGTTPSQGSGSISVSCTMSDAYNVEIGIGSGTGAADAATPTRYAMNGTNALKYQLYQDAAATKPFGDTVGTNTVALTGNGATQNTSFYLNFSTPALTLPAGSYTDTVAVTVAY